MINSKLIFSVQAFVHRYWLIDNMSAVEKKTKESTAILQRTNTLAH